MRELAATALRWISEGRAAVLARPVTEQGFGPRHPHDALLLAPGGTVEGTLYQGAFDAHLAAEAALLPASGISRVVPVAIHGQGASDAGLTCGGQAEVLLQPLDSVPAQWWSLLADGKGAALVTGLAEEDARTTSIVVAADGTVRAGDHGDAAAVDQAAALLRRHRSGRDVRYTDTGLTLIEVVPPVPHLLIVGGGELAALLTAQARLLGWSATTTQEASAALEFVADHADGGCLAMLSHDTAVDVPVIGAALRAGLPYVGALGSRRTTARRAEGLAAAGLSAEQIASVHGPLGLDLGARTPAETALAVCAEVLAALDARTARSLRDSDRPINA
ncbi:XdhC family protein [Yinghuangia soli]|uniref:XdhC family protein n=1 Tax=Yinghuangia soli TaxID=2908204 RepID=A0AA41U3M1_9ACTN|nr:XdhC/CoxI family protein [Yinghuangia soli]MCF2532888.1 XdhC family protein [Yinghuangia soli]